MLEVIPGELEESMEVFPDGLWSGLKLSILKIENNPDVDKVLMVSCSISLADDPSTEDLD